MAKVSTYGGWSISSDADLRAWLGECEQMLEDCGLVRTSDTGQIDPSLATWPGSNNTDIGFSVWQFDDDLQGVAPIFLKCTYWRGSSSVSVSFSIEVGTGSDGSGNLTGLTASITTSAGNGPGSGDYYSYACHLDGFAGLAFKVNGGNTSLYTRGHPAFIIERFHDNAGAPTSAGAVLIGNSGSIANASNDAAVRILDFLNSTVRSFDGNMAFVPSGITDSRVGLAPQIFHHWVMLPKMTPLIGSAACVRGEVAVDQQFELALVGSTPRNYVCIGQTLGSSIEGNTSINGDICMLFED